MKRRMLVLLFFLALLPRAAAEQTTLTLYHLQDVPGISAAIQDSAERFMRDHEGVKVEVNYLVNEVYKRRMAIAAATDNLPDVFSTWGGATLSEYAQLGKVLPLTEYMVQGDYQSRFLSAALSQITLDGDLWGVPVENVAPAVVFYNKEMFARLGLSEPETFEDLFHIIDVCVQNDVVPFALANRNAWPSSMYYMYLVDRLGGQRAFEEAVLRKDDGTPKNGRGFQDEKLITAWRYLIDLIERGAFPEDPNALDEDAGESRASFYREEAAMYLMGTWTFSFIESEYPDFYNKIDFFAFPSLDGTPGALIGTVGDNFYSISSKCENPELAFELIQYLIDDTAVDLRLKAGRYPPIRDVSLDKPLIDKVRSFVESAPSIHLWYDQWLPAKLAEAHKDICRAVFARSMSAEEAALAMEEAAAAYYASLD